MKRRTRIAIGVPLLLLALYSIAFHWGDWRWRDGTMLAVFWPPPLIELYFHKRPGFHNSVLCLIYTGMFALDLPSHALPITVAGVGLIAAGIALCVRAPSSFTGNGA